MQLADQRILGIPAQARPQLPIQPGDRLRQSLHAVQALNNLVEYKRIPGEELVDEKEPVIDAEGPSKVCDGLRDKPLGQVPTILPQKVVQGGPSLGHPLVDFGSRVLMAPAG